MVACSRPIFCLELCPLSTTPPQRNNLKCQRFLVTGSKNFPYYLLPQNIVGFQFNTHIHRDIFWEKSRQKGDEFCLVYSQNNLCVKILDWISPWSDLVKFLMDGVLILLSQIKFIILYNIHCTYVVVILQQVAAPSQKSKKFQPWRLHS